MIQFLDKRQQTKAQNSRLFFPNDTDCAGPGWANWGVLAGQSPCKEKAFNNFKANC